MEEVSHGEVEDCCQVTGTPWLSGEHLASGHAAQQWSQRRSGLRAASHQGRGPLWLGTPGGLTEEAAFIWVLNVDQEGGRRGRGDVVPGGTGGAGVRGVELQGQGLEGWSVGWGARTGGELGGCCPSRLFPGAQAPSPQWTHQLPLDLEHPAPGLRVPIC